MARRHDSLVPLTHDHHHALHRARLLRQGAEGKTDDRIEAASAFVDFFYADAVHHFREEEEQIFPLVIRHPKAPREGISRILGEHVFLHSLVQDLSTQTARGSVDEDAMRRIAATLRAHIRFEEHELFPAIERLVSAELDDVRLAPRVR